MIPESRLCVLEVCRALGGGDFEAPWIEVGFEISIRIGLGLMQPNHKYVALDVYKERNGAVNLRAITSGQ